MNQHPHAVADHCRRQHRTASDLRDLIRQSLPLHHLCSRVVNNCTVLFRTITGICGRALEATSPRETHRHGTLWTIKQWKRLAHYLLNVQCAAFFDTLSQEFLMLIPMGRSEDIRLALRQREMKNKKSNVANLVEAQWVRGKALPRGNRGTPWKKTPNDCDHPPAAIQKGGNAAMFYERCEICGKQWQRVPLTMVARDPETTLNNLTVLASTGKGPVEIERPFWPHGHGSMTMQATPQQKEPRGKAPRRAETSESVVPFHSSEASSSEIQQTSTAAASDNPTGERLYLSMTEEGPSGDYRMTMQRDRHGRWVPIKGERTTNIQKAREERRSFYVWESKEHGTFPIASAEASPLHGEFYLSRRNADEVSWNHLSDEEQTQFSKAVETAWQGVLDFKAVTIVDSTQAEATREKQRERVISSRFILRWKETDTGYKAKARWCVHGFQGS